MYERTEVNSFCVFLYTHATFIRKHIKLLWYFQPLVHRSTYFLFRGRGSFMYLRIHVIVVCFCLFRKWSGEIFLRITKSFVCKFTLGDWVSANKQLQSIFSNRLLCFFLCLHWIQCFGFCFCFCFYFGSRSISYFLMSFLFIFLLPSSLEYNERFTLLEMLRNRIHSHLQRSSFPIEYSAEFFCPFSCKKFAFLVFPTVCFLCLFGCIACKVVSVYWLQTDYGGVVLILYQINSTFSEDMHQLMACTIHPRLLFMFVQQ